MRFTFIFLLLFCISCGKSTQTTLEKVKGLDVNLIDGEVEVYYSTGYKNRAEANLNLLGNSIAYFKKQFNVTEKFSIAIIDSADWEKITRIPYGLPFVSGPPNIICIPANSNNELSRTITAAIEGYQLETKYGIPNSEIVNTFVSLIGFHELGHVYARDYGIHFPNKWTFEFAATYFAYSYLDRNFSKERNIWIDVANIFTDEIQPRYTSLSDFEKKYSAVGIKNYAWYQVVFLLQVKEIYENKGLDFLTHLRDYHWSSSSNQEFIDDMDKIDPGFTQWAHKYKLQ